MNYPIIKKDIKELKQLFLWTENDNHYFKLLKESCKIGDYYNALVFGIEILYNIPDEEKNQRVYFEKFLTNHILDSFYGKYSNATRSAENKTSKKEFAAPIFQNKQAAEEYVKVLFSYNNNSITAFSLL